MISRLRDLLVLTAFPKLRKQVHHGMNLGLETLLDYQRLAMLLAGIDYTSKLDGDVIEFGTYKGGSAGVMLQNLPTNKVLHLFDSFEGMPDVSIQHDFHKKGDFAETGADRVSEGLAKLGYNFELHVGYFSATIPEMEKTENLVFSMAHIDADLYYSILEALRFCYPRMTNGGVIIFDDYGSPTCPGAKKAVDEFFSGKPERVVNLTGPQYGTLVGGGDLRSALVGQLGPLLQIKAIENFVFQEL